MLTLQTGSEYVLATAALEFAAAVTSDEIEQTVVELEAQIKESVPGVKKMSTEAEGWRRG